MVRAGIERAIRLALHARRLPRLKAGAKSCTQGLPRGAYRIYLSIVSTRGVAWRVRINSNDSHIAEIPATFYHVSHRGGHPLFCPVFRVRIWVCCDEVL